MWLITDLKNIFFFNDTATTEIYTLSLHDALPILTVDNFNEFAAKAEKLSIISLKEETIVISYDDLLDRKSTRLNSSHVRISYAVFCLKKKNNDFLSVR